MSWVSWLFFLDAPQYDGVVVLNLNMGLPHGWLGTPYTMVSSYFFGRVLDLAWGCGCAVTGMNRLRCPSGNISFWVCSGAWDYRCTFTEIEREHHPLISLSFWVCKGTTCSLGL